VPIITNEEYKKAEEFSLLIYNKEYEDLENIEQLETVAIVKIEMERD